MLLINYKHNIGMYYVRKINLDEYVDSKEVDEILIRELEKDDNIIYQYKSSETIFKRLKELSGLEDISKIKRKDKWMKDNLKAVLRRFEKGIAYNPISEFPYIHVIVLVVNLDKKNFDIVDLLDGDGRFKYEDQ